MMKKIVVGIITYNQENVIGRALDSVLSQKDWGLYRIVISDDSSKDRTWDILCEYQMKFPDIVYCYRNQQNLGIYANVEQVESHLPDGDLYCNLSGDDEFCDGYFMTIQKLIEKQHIDTNNAIGFYSNWKKVLSNGKESIFKQDAVLSGYNLWSLHIRGLISSRSVMVTKKVHSQYEGILHGYGLNLTESHYDSQLHLNIQTAIYIPIVTSIYNAGIGVSTSLSIKKSDYYTKQSIEKWDYFLDRYIHDKRDKYYAYYETSKANFYMLPTWSLYLKMIYFFYRGQLSIGYWTSKKTIRNFMDLAMYKINFKIR